MQWSETFLRFFRTAFGILTGGGSLDGIYAIKGTESPLQLKAILIMSAVGGLVVAIDKFFRDNKILWGKAFPSKEATPPPPTPPPPNP